MLWYPENSEWCVVAVVQAGTSRWMSWFYWRKSRPGELWKRRGWGWRSTPGRGSRWSEGLPEVWGSCVLVSVCVLVSLCVSVCVCKCLKVSESCGEGERWVHLCCSAVPEKTKPQIWCSKENSLVIGSQSILLSHTLSHCFPHHFSLRFTISLSVFLGLQSCDCSCWAGRALVRARWGTQS